MTQDRWFNHKKGSFLAWLVLLVVIVLAHASLAMAQQQGLKKKPPPQAEQAVRQAMMIFQNQLNGSNLDWWLMGNAMAQLSQSLARIDNSEASRVMARNALALLSSPQEKAAPRGFGSALIYAILAQGFATVGDQSTAAGLINLSNQDLARTAQLASDNPMRASVSVYLARTALQMNDRASAVQMLDYAHKSLDNNAGKREQIAILSQMATVAGRLGDRSLQERDLAAAMAHLPALSTKGDLALGQAMVARALALAGRMNEAATLAREAEQNYNASTTEKSANAIVAIHTLGNLALALAASNNQAAARLTLNALIETVSKLTNPYEKFLGYLLLADASLESGI